MDVTLHVLVTRPEPGSTRTAALLRARGHHPLVLPLTHTVPLADNHDFIRRTPAGAYVVTSAAAVRYWQDLGLMPDQRAAPFYAVGKATGQSAVEAGFTDVRFGSGDGETLAGMILADAAEGRLIVSESAPLIYVTGRVRRSRFETLISDQKIPLSIVEIYDTQKISYSADFILRQIPSKDHVAVFLYSYRGARTFMEHMPRDVFDKVLKNCVFVCMSTRVASALPEAFKDQIRVAAAPNEAELLAQLDRFSDT